MTIINVILDLENNILTRSGQFNTSFVIAFRIIEYGWQKLINNFYFSKKCLFYYLCIRTDWIMQASELWEYWQHARKHDSWSYPPGCWLTINSTIIHPQQTRDVDPLLMVGQRRSRWKNIKPAMTCFCCVITQNNEPRTTVASWPNVCSLFWSLDGQSVTMQPDGRYNNDNVMTRSKVHPVNTKLLYNIYAMLETLGRRCVNVIQMFYVYRAALHVFGTQTHLHHLYPPEIIVYQFALCLAC